MVSIKDTNAMYIRLPYLLHIKLRRTWCLTPKYQTFPLPLLIFTQKNKIMRLSI